MKTVRKAQFKHRDPRKPLPGILADIDRIAGRDAALAVAKARGGASIYVKSAHRWREGDWLPKIVGLAVAKEISEGLHLSMGMAVTIPSASSLFLFERIKRLAYEGIAVPKIALEVGTTERFVWSVRKYLREVEGLKIKARPTSEGNLVVILDGLTKRKRAAALAVLSKTERRVIEARRLGEERVHLARLANELGVTTERARQIEAVAVQKVWKVLRLKAADTTDAATVQHENSSKQESK